MLKFRKIVQGTSMALAALFFFLVAQPAVVAQERAVSSSQAFEEFWPAFRRAVLKNDKASVASKTKFPLAGDYRADTKAIFLRKYSKIFNSGFRRLVSTSKPYQNAGGGYSVIYADRLYMSFEKEGGIYKLVEMGAYN